MTLRVSDVEEKYKEVLMENRSLKDEVLRLSNVVKQQASEINDMEQYMRDNVEISGVLEEPDEDTNNVVIQIGSFMGLQVDESDISVSHRLLLKRHSQSYALRHETAQLMHHQKL